MYTELSRRTEQTVITEVKFTFIIKEQSYERTFSIPHFMPQSENDIATGINNREASELRNLEAELAG